MGMVNSDIDSKKVDVVPHGVDIELFNPLEFHLREQLRQQVGWSTSFVFLHISSMTMNKNVDKLILAFSELRKKFSNIKLILKGNDELYGSEELLLNGSSSDLFKTLREENAIEYFGGQMSFEAIAQLHQLSDVYISPYAYEGFNIPVLEAMSVGNPVIVSKGGSTDDFVDDEEFFGLKI